MDELKETNKLLPAWRKSLLDNYKYLESFENFVKQPYIKFVNWMSGTDSFRL